MPRPMVALQLACVVILALYFALRSRREPGPARLLGRLGLLAAAAFAGEDTVIRAYGFYAYSPSWGLFLDRVPLLVVLIWPVVIHSAWDLARQVVGSRPPPGGVVLLGGAIVLADASLIEPIAVHAGLWRWTEPGLFGVPPIGVLGWAWFGAACLWLLEIGAGRARTLAAALLVAPLAAHAALLATWWGALRWVNHPIPGWPAAAAAWTLGATLAAAAWRCGVRRRVRPADMLARVPASLFFFVLLGLHARGAGPLWAWAAAFAPPYLALIEWRREAWRGAFSRPAREAPPSAASRAV